MRLVLIVFLFAALIYAQAPAAAPKPADPPKAAAAPKPADPAKSYAALQAEAVAKQRAAILKQLTPSSTEGSFFVLPPPAKLGATVFADAPATPECDPLPTTEIDRLVTSVAKRESVDESVLRSVMNQESAFRPCAVSAKGAMGLMQLMPATAQQFGVQDPFNPDQNVDAGARYLKELLTRYGGDLTLALGAYNAGPAKVDAAGGVPPIAETQEYIKRILSVLPFEK